MEPEVKIEMPTDQYTLHNVLNSPESLFNNITDAIHALSENAPGLSGDQARTRKEELEKLQQELIELVEVLKKIEQEREQNKKIKIPSAEDVENLSGKQKTGGEDTRLSDTVQDESPKQNKELPEWAREIQARKEAGLERRPEKNQAQESKSDTAVTEKSESVKNQTHAVRTNVAMMRSKLEAGR